jgi:predicted TIM-barrel fold metal-dependent hydrolase
LAEHPNLYADISAHSGYNALTRDPGFTRGVVERHWRKLLFGTDYFISGQEVPQVEWLRSYPMPEEWRDAIGGRNARHLLGI